MSVARLFAIALLIAVPAAPTLAQEMSAGDIVKALTPKKPGVTRSLSDRGLQVTQADAAAAPSIDMRVQFAYDSADLENEAELTLAALGQALSDPRLINYRFEIVGHTDAKGSAAYNLDLSKRRAASVVDYLVANYNLPADRIVAIGKGESDPANPVDPEAAENRRVEIVNIGQ